MHSYPAPPSEASPYPDVASHIPVLYTVLKNRDFHTIFEFGAGDYSTTLLMAMVRLRKGRKLYTGENVAKWRPTDGPSHYVSDTEAVCASAQSSATSADVAFVDCEAELRADILAELFNPSYIGLVVAHDTEPMHDRVYHMSRQLIRWPYGAVVRCPFTSIETTVVWRERDDDLLIDLARLSGDPSRHATAWNMAELACRMSGMTMWCPEGGGR